MQDALLQHVKRAVFQSSIWATSHIHTQNVPSPEGWGWVEDDEHSLRPFWMTIPEAAVACSELIKCGANQIEAVLGASGAKAALSCTDLCSCSCET